MRFTNLTAHPAGWTMGYQRDGRERLVVVVKATYTLPRPGEEPRLLEGAQVPLVKADQFTTEAVDAAAPLFETDYAHAKPACDVLLVGSAWAASGRPAGRVAVGLRVGTMVKQFVAVGERHWHKRLGLVSAGEPQPFESMRLTYDRAFGGTDRTREADGRVHAYEANPVGRGYRHYADDVDGQPLPNTEEAGKPVRHHDGAYRPMALSPVGRSWSPRRAWAGTYDEAWQKNLAPLWPADFDDRYFQAAPEEQVIPYPVGGEEVVLRNLTRDGARSFTLPRISMPITFIPHRGHDVVRQGKLDTLVLEPDEERFTMAWRVVLPLGRSIFDVKETLVGDTPARGRSQRFPGKTYYRSLGDAVRARRAGS